MCMRCIMDTQSDMSVTVPALIVCTYVRFVWERGAADNCPDVPVLGQSGAYLEQNVRCQRNRPLATFTSNTIFTLNQLAIIKINKLAQILPGYSLALLRSLHCHEF